MEKKLIARYYFSVFSDGTVTVERIPIDVTEEAPPPKEPSSKIKQILYAVRAMRRIYDEKFRGYDSDKIFSEVYTEGIADAAKHFSVSSTTVADKLSRKCGLLKPDWIAILKPFLLNNDLTKLRKVLMDNVKANEAELVLVEDFLRDMQNPNQKA